MAGIPSQDLIPALRAVASTPSNPTNAVFKNVVRYRGTEIDLGELLQCGVSGPQLTVDFWRIASRYSVQRKRDLAEAVARCCPGEEVLEERIVEFLGCWPPLSLFKNVTFDVAERNLLHERVLQLAEEGQVAFSQLPRFFEHVLLHASELTVDSVVLRLPPGTTQAAMAKLPHVRLWHDVQQQGDAEWISERCVRVHLRGLRASMQQRRDAAETVTVVYEGGGLAAVLKPAGWATVPHAFSMKGVPVLNHVLRAHWPQQAALRGCGICHRLDVGTSGAVWVGTSDAAALAIRGNLWRSTRIVEGRQQDEMDQVGYRGRAKKVYYALCVVREPLKQRRGVVQFAIDGKKAVTRFCVERQLGGMALVRCTIATGRHRQIRLHLAAIGLPVVNDRRVAGFTTSSPLLGGRLGLHAYEQTMVREDGRAVAVTLALPDDFLDAIRKLDGEPKKNSRGYLSLVLGTTLCSRRVTRASCGRCWCFGCRTVADMDKVKEVTTALTGPAEPIELLTATWSGRVPRPPDSDGVTVDELRTQRQQLHEQELRDADRVIDEGSAAVRDSNAPLQQRAVGAWDVVRGAFLKGAVAAVSATSSGLHKSATVMTQKSFQSDFPHLGHTQVLVAFLCQVLHGGVNVSGTLYVTPTHICYSNGGQLKVSVALADVVSVAECVSLHTYDGRMFLLRSPSADVKTDAVQLYVADNRLVEFVRIASTNVNAAVDAPNRQIRNAEPARLCTSAIIAAWRCQVPSVPVPGVEYSDV